MNSSGLRVGDIVKLNSSYATMLYDGNQFNKEQYQEIHQKDLTGEIVNTRFENNHYLYGEYAVVKWQNGFKSETIHTSWLTKNIRYT